MMSHVIFTPGQPGWLEALDRGLTLKPDSVKGYTIGDNTHKDTSRYESSRRQKGTYPAFERFVKAGIKNVCIHKGLFPPSIEAQFPRLRPYVDVSDVGKATRTGPSSTSSSTTVVTATSAATRHLHGHSSSRPGAANGSLISRRSPKSNGVTNVYGDVGQLFAFSTIAQPKLAAALMGTLVKGLGVAHVVWGTDALWTGSPQWQIESLRRLEIPEDMQKKFGFAPLGAADGPVKTAIFGGNSKRLYGFVEKGTTGIDSID